MLVTAVAALLVAYGTVLNLGPVPRRAGVPLNLAVGTVLVAAARAAGIGWSELGLDTAALPAGVRSGVLAAGVVAAGIAVATALAPRLRGLAALFGDRRAAGVAGRALAYETLVRIPLATSLFEEVAFRGVLLALGLRSGSEVAAVLVSSAAFGLWHVGPTLEMLRLNGVAWTAPRTAATVAGAVAVTAVGGIVFAVLRLHSGSLAAPVLAHWATNALALLAAVHLRSTGVVNDPPGT